MNPQPPVTSTDDSFTPLTVTAAATYLRAIERGVRGGPLGSRENGESMDSNERPEPTDPTTSTSGAMKRRLFVGLGAGATFGGSIAAALAAGSGFGAPHPPIVAEDDPAISLFEEKLLHRDQQVTAYGARPQAAPRGGIVVIQAIWGVDNQLRDVVRRFAKEGYVALAPDLYAGLGPAGGEAVSDYQALSAKLADATVDADVRAAAQWLLKNGSRKVGATGFCMGGGITLRQAVDTADILSAVAVWYGKVRYSTSNNNNGPITPIALAYADAVRVPMLGSFGGRDTSILPADVRALDGQLTIAHDLKIYENAGHAFFDDTRQSYVAAAAADAWTRTLGWFARYLS